MSKILTLSHVQTLNCMTSTVVTLIVISFSFSVGAKATIIVTIQFVLYHVLIIVIWPPLHHFSIGVRKSRYIYILQSTAEHSYTVSVTWHRHHIAHSVSYLIMILQFCRKTNWYCSLHLVQVSVMFLLRGERGSPWFFLRNLIWR